MKCPLKFYLSEEEVLRKQLHSINLSPNDIYIIDDEDVCVMKVVKPEGKAKCKHGSKVDEANPTPLSQHVPKTIISGTSHSRPICSVMLEKISIRILMKNGGHENMLMLKTFEFVTKVRELNIEFTFIL